MQLKQEIITSQLKSAVFSKNWEGGGGGGGTGTNCRGLAIRKGPKCPHILRTSFSFSNGIIMLSIVFHSVVIISSIGESVIVLSMFLFTSYLALAHFDRNVL